MDEFLKIAEKARVSSDPNFLEACLKHGDGYIQVAAAMNPSLGEKGLSMCLHHKNTNVIA